MDKLKIFTLENNEDAIKIIKTVCRNHHLHIETSSSAAMKVIETKEFHIYLINYKMPGINGIGILSHIKKMCTDRPYVSILHVARGTTHLFNEELVRGLFSYFLEKPFKMAAFKDILKKAFIKLGKLKNRDE
jgi:DNA-binding NtrC family response regulator